MPLSAGDKLGPYEIVDLIGKGGMGEVYRARDTRLDRLVALKVSQQEFSDRFEREARVVASLSHSNICTLHDVGPNYLVMEFVEGDSPKGPLPVEEVLRIGRQIASALDAAHEKGIIHRDLKPANIKIKPDGTVKVLDFGLAKMTAPAESTSTISLGATEAGVILGTAAYMAPEQARGQTVDKRADIWSFGVVLYELLTGHPPFASDTVSDTLAAVLTREPDWSGLPEGTPVTTLRRCLEKDVRRRLRDVADALLEPEVPATPVLVARRRQPVVLALAVLAIASSAAALYFSRRTAPTPPATHLVIPLPAGQEITGAPAISPDGRTVAYVAKSQAGEAQLYLRDLGSFTVRLVEQSAGALYPFFSPDGVWVAFEARGQIFKAAITGGAPVKMADAPEPDGADWVEDGTLVFPLSFSSGLARIPASGGKAEAITKPDGGKFGLNHGLPQALPGGKFILFTVHGKEVNGTALLSLETRQWQLALPNQTGGVYASSGQIFASNTNAEVRAATFDPQHPMPVNADNLVLSDVSYQAYDLRPYLAVSKNGTLVYAPGNPSKKTLVWVDRQGAVQPASPQQADYIFLHLSPDGTRAVVDEDTGLWIHDLQRGSRSRLVQGSSHPVSPIWSPDGKRIDFSYDLEGDFDIYWQPADGSRAPERLLKRPYNQYAESIAPDGTLAFAESDPVTGEDLLLLAPDGRVTPWQVRQAYDSNARFSPDGRWLAYDSDESGRREVYVEAFPSRNKKALVSSGGGIIPIWSHDGKELFYCSPDSIMAVAVGGDGAFGQPRRLFDRSEYYFDFQTYDVSPDAKRFLMIRPDPGSVPRQLNVILNWFDELRKR